MTKRYGMSNETGAFIDKQIDKEYTDDEIIDLLNEQHERIQVLKASNGEMEDYLARLEEKNEQLKADKQSLIDFIKKEFPKSHKHILEGFND